jgi:hypothetical protein
MTLPKTVELRHPGTKSKAGALEVVVSYRTPDNANQGLTGSASKWTSNTGHSTLRWGFTCSGVRSF